MKTSFNFSTFNLKAGLFALAVGALVAACADYNVTDDFTAEPDPTFVEPYKDYGTVKSYLDREKYPNMTLGAQLKVAEFNKQELAHAVAITNFDDLAFGTTLMSGTIVNAKGIMNFLDMKDLLDHVQEIGGKVFGSPIVANANQADDWLNMLTAPIEIPVDYVEGKTVNFNEMSVGDYTGTVESGSASIAKYDDQNALKIGLLANVRIVEGFEVDSLATYTITFRAYTVPYWQQAGANRLTATGSSITRQMGVGGSADTVLDIAFHNTSGATCDTFKVQAGASMMELRGLGLANGETLHIDHTDDGVLRIRIQNGSTYRSALDKRTTASSDDLWVSPSSVAVTMTAQRTGTLTMSCAGRFV